MHAFSFGAICDCCLATSCKAQSLEMMSARSCTQGQAGQEEEEEEEEEREEEEEHSLTASAASRSDATHSRWSANSNVLIVITSGDSHHSHFTAFFAQK